MPVHILLRSLRTQSVHKVTELSGENIYKCMQCGTCSGVCPMSEYGDLTPRAAMLLIQHGRIEAVARATTPWLCASCHTCEVRCPRGIKVPRVIEAIRQVVLRSNEDHINPRTIPEETIKRAPQIAMVSGFRKMTA